MSGTPDCGELEFVVINSGSSSDVSSRHDFVEVVDNDLLVYCDWHTKKTGAFDVNVAARLKWFVSEMSTPVTFRVILNENCNKPGPYGLTPAETKDEIRSALDANDRVFTYGEIVLVIFFFILSTFLGAAIAYMLVSPVKVSGCSKVSAEQVK